MALRFNPWQRFLLLVATATVMALPSLLVRPASPWWRLCRWLRSGGATLLLFACTAAGGLPHPGLQWLNDPIQSLALPSAAMAVNLLLAAVAANETVAGLHVVACLVPLTIAPQGGLILAVANLLAAVGLAAVGLVDHLTLLADGAGHALAHTSRLLISGLLLGGGALALASQRRVHRPDPLPAATSLGWIGAQLLWLGSAMVAPAAWQPWLSLAVLSVALLATRRWPLAGASSGLAVAVTLLHLGSWLQLLRALLWPMASLAELTLPPLLLALLLVFSSREALPRQTGWLLLCLSEAMWGLQTLGVVVAGVATAKLTAHALLVQAGGALLVAVQLALQRWRLRPLWPGLMGWLGPALLLLGSLGCLPRPVADLTATGLLQLALLLGLWLQPPGLLAGTATATAILMVSSWLWLLPPTLWTWPRLLPRLLPLVLVVELLVLRSGSRTRRWAPAAASTPSRAAGRAGAGVPGAAAGAAQRSGGGGRASP